MSDNSDFTSIKVTIKSTDGIPTKIVDNGRPLAGDNLTACMYEACANAWGACIGLDHDKIASVTIEVLRPLREAVVPPSIDNHDKAVSEGKIITLPYATSTKRPTHS